VARLPRQPGRKEYRYAHMLGGEVALDSTGGLGEPDSPTESTREKIERLEAEIEELRREFAEFKKQFE